MKFNLFSKNKYRDSFLCFCYPEELQLFVCRFVLFQQHSHWAELLGVLEVLPQSYPELSNLRVEDPFLLSCGKTDAPRTLSVIAPALKGSFGNFPEYFFRPVSMPRLASEISNLICSVSLYSKKSGWPSVTRNFKFNLFINLQDWIRCRYRAWAAFLQQKAGTRPQNVAPGLSKARNSDVIHLRGKVTS